MFLLSQRLNTKGNRVPVLQGLLGLCGYYDKSLPEQQGVLCSENDSSAC